MFVNIFGITIKAKKEEKTREKKLQSELKAGRSTSNGYHRTLDEIRMLRLLSTEIGFGQTALLLASLPTSPSPMLLECLCSVIGEIETFGNWVFICVRKCFFFFGWFVQ